MDFTAVWGITPQQAPDVLRKFGTTEAVETKVVIPQIESICRNQGSRLGAVELLVGESRMKFQEDTTAAFEKVLQEKDLTLLHGLVRHIYIPLDVRQPIQERFIADEIKLTNEQKQITRKTEATLQEATAKVEYESQRVEVETEKLEAERIAEGRPDGRRDAGRNRAKAGGDRQAHGGNPGAAQRFSRARPKRRPKSCWNRPRPRSCSWPSRRSARPIRTTSGSLRRGLPDDLQLHCSTRATARSGPISKASATRCSADRRKSLATIRAIHRPIRRRPRLRRRRKGIWGRFGSLRSQSIDWSGMRPTPVESLVTSLQLDRAILQGPIIAVSDHGFSKDGTG